VSIPPSFNNRTQVPLAPHFGRLNLAMASSEISPCKVGGLSVVSDFLRDSLPQHTNDEISMTVIQPHLKPMQVQDADLKRKKLNAYEDSGLTLALDGAEGVSAPVKVLQRQNLSKAQKKLPDVEKADIGWTYSLSHPLFNEENLFTYVSDVKNKKEKAGKVPLPLTVTDQAFSKNMLKTRATAQLLQILQSGKIPEGTKLHVFKNKFDGIIANDWMDGALFHELDSLKAKSAKAETVNANNTDSKYIFFTHNQYSEDRPLSHAARLGVALPTDPKLHKAAKANHEGQTEGMYSPLSMGIHKADLVFIDKNYAKTHADSPLTQEHIFRDLLKDKVEAGKISTMHHAPSVRFNPSSSPDLKREGFQNLKPADKTMAEFKAMNKKALQTILKLKQDPNAIVMTWMSRIENGQKGSKLLLDSMIQAVKENPKLQIVFFGKGDDNDKLLQKSINSLQAEIKQNPDLSSRIYFPNKMAGGALSRRIAQSYAGSDFVILPSMYEPYGLTQLEATSMGAIPLVHGVDGIRSTVSDPNWNGKSWIPKQNVDAKTTKDPEKVWQYGQTGVMMEPIPVMNYRRSLFRNDRLASTELKLNQATEKNAELVTAGMLEGIGNIAKEALFDINSGLSAEKDGFAPPKITEKDRETLQEIKNRLVPVPPAGTDPKKLEAAKLREMTAEERQSLLKDISTLRGIFDEMDGQVLEGARQKFLNGMNDAIKLAKDPDKMGEVRRNGRRYVNENHSPKGIVKNFYKPAFDKLFTKSEILPQYSKESPPSYTEKEIPLPVYSENPQILQKQNRVLATA
jgi:glycosyltransferase involved in cell wall biosynthesis